MSITLKELRGKINRIYQLSKAIEKVPVSANDPNLWRWVDKADEALNEIYEITVELLGTLE